MCTPMSCSCIFEVDANMRVTCIKILHCHLHIRIYIDYTDGHTPSLPHSLALAVSYTDPQNPHAFHLNWSTGAGKNSHVYKTLRARAHTQYDFRHPYIMLTLCCI